MRITFVISSLGPGGAERVMTTMANAWSMKGWQITIITLSDSKNDFYELHENIQRIPLDQIADSSNIFQALKENIKRIYHLRKALHKSKPDVVISFIDIINILTLISAKGLKVPVIVSERADPGKHQIGRLWNGLRKKTYSGSSALVVQEENVRQWALSQWHNLKVQIIHNPIQLAFKNDKEISLPPGKWVMAMGRLVDQKGFDLLIKAFAMAVTDIPEEWNLLIMGEGEQRKELENLVKKKGLEKRVSMPGLVNNPDRYLSLGELFVLSSRYEGFPNALLEAMASGLPVISFNCPSGPAEIIHHEVDGILVEPENIDALSEAIITMIKSDKKRSEFELAGRNNIERFGLEKILQEWETLIQKLVKQC